MLNELRLKIKGMKTVVVGSGMAVLSYLEYADLTTIVSKENAPLVTLGLGLVMVVLRFNTNTSIGKSK